MKDARLRSYVLTATTYLLLLVLLNGFGVNVYAQALNGGQERTVAGVDIPLTNPSLEDAPKVDAAPRGWFTYGQTPDIQPGIGDIHQPASNGQSYAGCLHASYYDEAIGQQLSTPLKAGVTYAVSFDLAYPAYYSTGICSGSFAIYGSNNAGEKQVLLWHIEGFMHKDWRRYTAEFTPTTDFKYILVGPDNDAGCPSSKYTAVLFDNFSNTLHALPVISTESTNTCAGSNNGSARVKVSDNGDGYQYLWTPGNYTTASVAHLPAGKYNVQVTDPQGVISNRTVIIQATMLQVVPKVTLPTCADRTDASITLQAAGGVAPYTFSINDRTVQDTPQFSHLAAGTYQATVQDAMGCATTIEQITIDNPASLQINSIAIHPVSCDNNEPQITVVPEGGIPPYSFSIDGAHWQTENTWYRLDAGNYEVVVSDAQHCEIKTAASVTRDDTRCAVMVPNAFSPNNDGHNDVFKPQSYATILHYRLTIFNRWGQQLFDTADPNTAWDGYFKGQLQDAGAYVWVLTYRDMQAQDRKQTGAVLLVRN
ncbi:T9SS type B sorting domain-containing protein [Chitinophaga costaii]|nr:gliding motility-associated C-terminal domain-containing protein [Chitinophaga costaii]